MSRPTSSSLLMSLSERKQISTFPKVINQSSVKKKKTTFALLAVVTLSAFCGLKQNVFCGPLRLFLIQQ